MNDIDVCLSGRVLFRLHVRKDSDKQEEQTLHRIYLVPFLQARCFPNRLKRTATSWTKITIVSDMDLT